MSSSTSVTEDLGCLVLRMSTALRMDGKWMKYQSVQVSNQCTLRSIIVALKDLAAMRKNYLAMESHMVARGQCFKVQSTGFTVRAEP